MTKFSLSLSFNKAIKLFNREPEAGQTSEDLTDALISDSFYLETHLEETKSLVLTFGIKIFMLA